MLSCKSRLNTVELHLRLQFNIGTAIPASWNESATVWARDASVFCPRLNAGVEKHNFMNKLTL